MKIEMIMPQMGESIAEGTIVKWRKGVGDWVELDEDILEISTDKVDSEIPSPATGRIVEIIVNEGETVAIETVLLIIETEGAESKGAGKDDKEITRPPAQESSPHDASDGGGLSVKEFKKVTKEKPKQEKIAPKDGKKSTFISPLVQSIAAADGIPFEEIHQIQGSGRDGRVTKKDMLAYVKERKNKSVSAPAAPKAAPPTAVKPAPPPEPQHVWRSQSDEVVEMDRMRRMIADHMVKSVHTSPHVVSFSDVDMTAVVKHREALKGTFRAEEGINITYTSYFIYVVARALKEFPYINASVDGYNVILRKQINIGFAVELPDGGLIVPVIKGVDALNLTGIARGLHDLAEKARNGKLDPEDVSGGTFTITNVGVFGNISGAPIINQPQVAILGTGAIQKRPVVIETETGDTIGIRSMMIKSLSYDHRIIDGAMAGRFMARVAQLLENFEG